MRYMQVIEAQDINHARQSYMELLKRRGVAPSGSLAIFVETVHRPGQQARSDAAWLCYLAAARPQAA